MHEVARPPGRLHRGTPSLLLLLASCAVRTGTVEHYVGPALYRSGTACRDGADVTEVLQVGGAAETGHQWGVSFGILDRVAATPRDGRASCTPDASTTGDHARWYFSPLYVRFERREAPRFVHRSIVGTQAVTGSEASGVSVGAISATVLLPPPDAYCSFRYDASDPTGMRFTVWSVGGEDRALEDQILKEVDR
jgi:hypothetical protein